MVLSSYNSLEDLYRQRASDADILLKRLKEWCEEAEQSGVSALQEYVKVVRAYTLTELPNGSVGADKLRYFSFFIIDVLADYRIKFLSL